MSTPVNLGKQTLSLSEIITPVKCFLILLFSFLLFLPYTGSSQNKARLMIKGCVIDENNKKIMGAKLTLYKNSRKVYTKTTSSTGKFEFALETNYKYRNEYILEVIKKSYPVKKYKFSTFVPSDARPSGEKYWIFHFDIRLVKPLKGRESSVSNSFFAYVGYDVKKNLFAFDKEDIPVVKPILVSSYDQVTNSDEAPLEKIRSTDSDTNKSSKFRDFYAKLLYGKEVKKPLADQTVMLENSIGKVLQTSKTDIYGDFSFEKINTEERHTMVLGENKNIPPGTPVFLAKQNGIIINEFIKGKNNRFIYELLPHELYKLTLIEEDDVSLKIEGFQKSDKKEITIVENINYSSGSWDIQPGAAKELAKIVDILKQNPNLTIELSSHTDAIGNDAYNRDLSEKRAKSAVQFIISKGVEKMRIRGKGYGESKILNRCLNGVKCSEKEHRLNRRTEIKFVKV